MMVRETSCPERLRDRDVAPGAQIVISPWHLHRHTRLWDNPDGFDPERWGTENGKTCLREAFIPFSAGARVCPGAGFAMVEGPLILSMLLRAFRFEVVAGRAPVPVAHLTVRAKDGIWLRVTRRESAV
jgi:cytochrome P450